MEKLLDRLRKAGSIGSFVANVIKLLTTNWVVAMSAVIAIYYALQERAVQFVLDPRTLTGIVIFLFLLWTVIGLTYLNDRRKPRLVQSHHDYRYGLTFQGCSPIFSPESSPIASQRGTFAVGFQVQNFTPGPIKYTLESAQIQIGTRTIPKYKLNSVTGYMARGGAKIMRPAAFPPGSLKEFYGIGETNATADIVIAYGPPDEPPVRRLKLNIEMILVFPPGGMFDGTHPGLGYGDNVVSEVDEPI